MKLLREFTFDIEVKIESAETMAAPFNECYKSHGEAPLAAAQESPEQPPEHYSPRKMAQD